MFGAGSRKGAGLTGWSYRWRVWCWAGLLALGVGLGAAKADEFIILQSTTSTQNSGLFDHILPQFTEASGIAVRVVAVGTGQAIKNAQNGDGDVLLVHSKPAEEQFVADGFGVARFDVMYNDFVIVGPKADPAGLQGMTDSVAALRRLSEQAAVFISRGDDSGTHKKELSLWAEAGLTPGTAWYREVGAGMGAALNIAVGMDGYIMTDRATWIAFANKADHVIHVAGDPRLFNQYGVILVNPEQHPHVSAMAGQAFIDWLLSPAGQAAIASHHIAGQQLFFPNASAVAE